MLFIPPYWLHQTATLVDSVAVNIWSPSAEAKAAAKALELLNELHPALHSSGSKRGALCTAARALYVVAQRLVEGASSEVGEAGESSHVDAGPPNGEGAQQLLQAIFKAQHAHLRMRSPRSQGGGQSLSAASRAAASASSNAASPTLSPFDVCAGEATATREAEALAARRISQAISLLPPGVRELTLADLATQLAEHVASSVAPPAWTGDKGRLRAIKCLLLDMGQETCR